MKKLNLNEFIKVKLTDLGKDCYYHRYDEFNSRFGGSFMIPPRYPDVDEYGFTKFQLHEFMDIYGRYMTIGFNNVIENNDIYICEKDLREVDNSAFDDMIRAIQAIGVSATKAKEAISKLDSDLTSILDKEKKDERS